MSDAKNAKMGQKINIP